MHARKGQWIAAAASMLAVVTTVFALPVLNPSSGDPSTSLETVVPPASPSPINGTEQVVAEVAREASVWEFVIPTAAGVEGGVPPNAPSATTAGALSAERPAVPAGTGTTPSEIALNSTGQPGTEATLPPVELAALETTTASFQNAGVGQANSETLISQAMAALESLKQLASQPPAACAPASIKSINNIPVDSGGTETIHNVTIGDGFTRFTPAIIKARAGETITFTWVGKNNHSVTESDQLGSCTKSALPTAFDSGVQPPGTVWNLTLPANARGLKFFYCKVAMHCAKTGMSGTIITPE